MQFMKNIYCKSWKSFRRVCMKYLKSDINIWLEIPVALSEAADIVLSCKDYLKITYCVKYGIYLWKMLLCVTTNRYVSHSWSFSMRDKEFQNEVFFIYTHFKIADQTEAEILYNKYMLFLEKNCFWSWPKIVFF